MKPFRERNPVPIALIGVAVLLFLLFAAFNSEKLPLIGGGKVYNVAFAEAAGLKPGDEVRIAGVKVGKVDDVALQGRHVEASIRVKGASFGNTSRAAIKIKTLLGQKFVDLQPDGPGQLRSGGEIPLSRTVAPFDVVPAFSGLSDTVGQIDTESLAKSFDTISADFKNTPPEVQGALTGLSRLSQTIASRDNQLGQLLTHANGVTKVLADRDREIVTLLGDGDLVLQTIKQRREAIHQLLINTSVLSQQLTGLVQDNQASLNPTLVQLHGVLDTLNRNQANLDTSLQELAPFVRVFTNTLGNGRWFDTFTAIGALQPTVGG